MNAPLDRSLVIMTGFAYYHIENQARALHALPDHLPTEFDMENHSALWQQKKPSASKQRNQ